MHRVLPIFLFAMAFMLFGAADAFAWGPGVHCAVADLILANMGGLPSAVTTALMARPDHFIYGSLSADIFIGKGCRMKPGHSHSWAVGFDILRTALTNRMRAYAYGYLAHLAADTVAHNYFVPNLLNRGPVKGKANHVYLEYLAEGRVTWRPHEVVDLFGRPFSEPDKSLVTAVSGNAAHFQFKKRLFRSTLHMRKGGDLPLRLLGRLRPLGTDSTSFLDEMLKLTNCTVRDILKRPENSPVLDLDPIGERPLLQAGSLTSVAHPTPGSMFPVPSHVQELAPCLIAEYP